MNFDKETLMNSFFEARRQGLVDYLMSHEYMTESQAQEKVDQMDTQEFDDYCDRQAETLKQEIDGNRQREIDFRYERYVEKIPLRYRDANIMDFDKTMRIMANKMIAGKSMICVGRNGIGKTRLGWALCKEWMRKGEMCIFIKASQLLDDFKDAVRSSLSLQSVYERYISPSHLIIDEIDKIKGSEADFQYLSNLIDERYAWCKQTIVMGNLPEGRTLVDLVGQSNYSRLSGEESESAILNSKNIKDWRG